MAGALKRVEQEMAALDQAVADLAVEMKSVYSSYLAVLGQAVYKQLILACYRLCTQGYPEAFLQLSFPQRQQFQQALRTLAAQAANRLTHLLTAGQPETSTGPEATTDPDHQAGRPLPPDLAHLSGQTLPEHSWDEEEILSSLAAGMKAALEQAQAENRLPQGLDSGNFSAMMQAFFKQSQATESSDSSPVERLVRWQKCQETAIVEQLQRTSYQANRLLQRFNILHQHLPDQVFSAIARADTPEGSSQSPHILNLLVETKERERPSVVVPEANAETKNDGGHPGEMDGIDEIEDTDEEGDDEGKYRQPALTHLIALNLRLAEIEFIDPNVMAGRNRIRDLTARLKQLRRTYRKKQREWAILEAEAAWRSSWVED